MHASILCVMILSILVINLALVKIIYIVFFLLLVVVIHVVLLKQKKKEEDIDTGDIYISHLTKKEHSGYTGSIDTYSDKISSKN